MKPLNESEFYIKKSIITKSWLNKNDFLFSKIFSDEEDDVYYYRFVVWRYGNAGVLEAEIRISTSGEVKVNCFDYGTRNIYASWYCRDFGNNDVVTQIDEKIRKELERLGITEK
mgnify:CR=1 FL=1